jgi:hypothetical protein
MGPFPTIRGLAENLHFLVKSADAIYGCLSASNPRAMNMLERRSVLTGLLGAGAVGLAGVPAGAASHADFTGAGHAPRSAEQQAIRRDNCSFYTEAQAVFADDIARGAAPAGSERTVFCPLCRDSITMTG